ncbi:hypothetical protein [Ruminococcus sp.]|jgi:hypothetical protein|uniref:hypothetical protein n=1 Tax=Ruminococcus sp. TaxID=41978 RepID=UPI00399B83B5
MADAFSVCQFIPFEKSRRFFLRLRLFHDFETIFAERLPIFWICGIINNSEEKGGGMP